MHTAEPTAATGRSLTALGLLLITALYGLACSSSGQPASTLTVGTGTSGSGNIDPTGNGTGGTGTDPGGFDPGGMTPGAVNPGAIGNQGGSGGMTSFDQCAAETNEATSTAIDMYIISDKTGSMGEDCPLDVTLPPAGGSSKWCFASHALAGFFMAPEAANHQAALQFMTSEGFTCEGGPGNAHATPVVGLTPLPVAATDGMITSIDAMVPVEFGTGNGTAIESALRGLATWTEANRTDGRTMIGILITDGEPTECSTDPNALAGVLSDHLEATGIRTFIIGMTGAEASTLETMAVAGGAPEHADYCIDAGPCHYWSVGDGDPATFVNALQQITEAAVIPCEYALPDPGQNQSLDTSLVNIVVEDAAGTPTVIPKVTDANACAMVAGITTTTSPHPRSAYAKTAAGPWRRPQ